MMILLGIIITLCSIVSLIMGGAAWSCILALLLGAGLPIAFFLFNSLSGLDTLEFLKYFSLNTLFDTGAIISGGGFVIQFVAMFAIGIALYCAGVFKFLKKDLPL